MAWYPEARKLVISPGPNDPPIEVVGAILHVDAGNSSNLFSYFKDKSDGIESHFHIPREGPLHQYRDTHFEADANLKANSFYKNGRRFGFVSIETQGLAEGEWNAHQLAQIKRLLRWLAQTHNFPLRKTDSPQGPGVGYHTLFGAPGPWTPNAKTCPGPDRIRQFNNVLVPWFASGAPSGTDAPPIGKDELDMDEKTLRAIIEDELNKQDKQLWTDRKSGTGNVQVIQRLERMEKAVGELLKKAGGDAK